jgi:hypothetical protein
MLGGDGNVLPGKIGHLDREYLVERAIAQRLHRGFDKSSEAVFVLHQDGPRLPRQVAKGAQQHHRLDVSVPIGRRVELRLNIAEAVTLQNQNPVAERAAGLDRSVDVAAHVEKILGIDGGVMLACIDRSAA